ncbi:MAG TPA: DUF2269 domain-containing protein [Burkholderiales bacterium]
MIPHEFWKTAHVLSAAIIFGTGLGIAFFTWFGYRGAMRSRDIGALRSVLRLTVIADACLTAPAVAFQAASGLVLMNRLGWPLVSAWSIAVWGLFLFAGACWIPVVLIQLRLNRESQRVSSIDALPAWFHTWFKRWFALGVPAFAAVIAIYWLMIAKPLAVAGS